MTFVKFHKHGRQTRNAWMDEFFGKDFWDLAPAVQTRGSMPAVNVKETPDSFELEMAAPGLSKEDFNVKLDQKNLVISSEKETGKEGSDENGSYSFREFGYSSFSRSFTLPDTVDSSKISASYENGVLQLTIPKREEAKEQPPREISIN